MQVMDQRASDRCEKLQNPNYVNLVVSVIILIGLFVSYLPQHYRIIHRRTSEGISPYFILLGTTSATASFANIVTLPLSRADVACCQTVSSFECAAGLLGITQVGVQWICFSVIFVLFLIFFPRGHLIIDTNPDRPTWRTALTIAAICIAYGFFVTVVSATLLISQPQYLSTWANLLGLSAALLAAIQYLPQIHTTYQLKHVGSLSIPMMCIQTPGGFVFAASLFARLGADGWSTWGVYLVTATCQGVLLAMGIFYEIQARKRTDSVRGVYEGDRREPVETDDEGGAVVEGERRPLIGKRKSGRR